MMIFDLALIVATVAHKGQVDKAGADYIEHPKAVAAQLATDEEKAVAYLHDVLEDTQLTADDLEAFGFPAEVVTAVVTLTKQPGQSYEDYLVQVKTNDLARRVKLADLTHNADLSRLPEVTATDVQRQAKYLTAKAFLQDQSF